MKNTLLISSFALVLTACSSQTTQTQSNTPLDSAQVLEQTSASESAQPDKGVKQRIITLAEIAQHPVEADCWMAIDGQVYDVTGFIASGNHGGGEAILQGCGKDATELFDTRPMGSGTPHSSKARDFLPNFKIGELAK
jgi:cytochrome b involved in lipid metabolism